MTRNLKTVINSGIKALAAVLVAALTIFTVSIASADIMTQLGQEMAAITEKVKPAVVNIATSKTVKAPRLIINNKPVQKQQKSQLFSLGSGVIVSQDGYIITCNHVVDGADDILVRLSDDREFKGTVVGKDSKSDIAVIKIPATGLSTLQWGDSSKLRQGEIVIAYGNPFGLSQTVTMGIVSATGRTGMGIVDYEDFIQTDASINPGNSGGALVNSRGELIGINDAIYSTSGGNQGIGFAVPANMAKNILDSLLNKGKVIRGYIGVQGQPISAELSKQFGMKDDKGVLLVDVTEGAPAEKAGLRRGDVIVGIDGKPIENAFQLRNQIAASQPGQVVQVDIIRDNKPMTVPVTIGELPGDPGEQPLLAPDNLIKGVSVQELTPELHQQLQLKKDITGVVVSGVDEDSRALGVLKRGDVIMEINRKLVRNMAEYRKAATDLKKDADIVLFIIRNRAGQYLTITAR